MGKRHTIKIRWYEYIFMILVSSSPWYNNTIPGYDDMRWYIQKNDTNDTKYCIFPIFWDMVHRRKSTGPKKLIVKSFYRNEMIKILSSENFLKIWRFLQTEFQNFSLFVMRICYILNFDRKIIELFDTKILLFVSWNDT